MAEGNKLRPDQVAPSTTYSDTQPLDAAEVVGLLEDQGVDGEVLGANPDRFVAVSANFQSDDVGHFIVTTGTANPADNDVRAEIVAVISSTEVQLQGVVFVDESGITWRQHEAPSFESDRAYLRSAIRAKTQPERDWFDDAPNKGVLTVPALIAALTNITLPNDVKYMPDTSGHGAYLDVFLDGALKTPSVDYNEVDTTEIEFLTDLNIGQVLIVIAHG